MQAPPSIIHYRLGAGRVFESRRADVTDRAIEILKRMLIPGVHEIPNTPAWSVQTSITGSTLTATVRSGDRALLRIWVILDGRDLRLVFPPPRVLDLNVPACLVEILHEQPFDPVVGWLRDFELTLAWAWVMHHTCLDSAALPEGSASSRPRP